MGVQMQFGDDKCDKWILQCGINAKENEVLST